MHIICYQWYLITNVTITLGFGYNILLLKGSAKYKDRWDGTIKYWTHTLFTHPRLSSLLSVRCLGTLGRDLSAAASGMHESSDITHAHDSAQN